MRRASVTTYVPWVFPRLAIGLAAVALLSFWIAKIEYPGRFIVLLAAGVVITLVINRLGHSRRRIAKESALLSLTLASIRDAVIVTNDDGRIVFTNAEAERLTGCPGSAALGRSLRGIFRIKNEETGAPLENPVDMTLRLKSVINLPNHTALRTANGLDIPIDGSSAPVLERDGTIHGVILIFRDFAKHGQAEEKACRLLFGSEPRGSR
jgi:PAS domain S-box-containing protein